MQTLVEQLNVPAPRLESLRLWPEDRRPALVLPEPVLGNSTPRLRHLALWDCMFSWDTPLLTRLTHLELHRVATLPTMTQVLTVLDNVPLLRTLILEDSCPVVPPDIVRFGPADRVASLQQLSVLNVSGNIQECANLLNHLSYPPSAAMKLSCSRHPESDFDSLLHLLSAKNVGGPKAIRTLAIHQLYTSATMVTIQAWHTSYRGPGQLPCGTPQVDFLFALSDLSTVEALIQAVCKVLSITQLRSLDVHEVSFTEKAWFDTFGKIKTLQTLHVCCDELPPALFLALGKVPGNSVKKKSSRLLFPQLHTLSFEGVRFSDYPSLLLHSTFTDLERCLMLRCLCDAPVQTIHIIECKSVWSLQVKALKEIVVDVFWDGLELFSEDEEDDFDDSDDYSDYYSDDYLYGF
jgi:hypothetical protein